MWIHERLLLIRSVFKENRGPADIFYMKKYMVYGLGVVLFSVLSCTRSAVEKNGASVIVKVPHLEQVQSKNSSGFVDTLLKKNSLQTLASTSVVTTGLDGLYPLNCFAVLVSGPIDSLKRNRCYRKSPTTSSISFYTGGVSQVVGPGGNIELNDLESGPDRVFRLIGLRSKSGLCPNILESRDEYGDAYIVSEVGGVSLDAGATMSIPMAMSFESDRFFDRCEGPDFPERSGGGSSGGAKKLAVRKDYFPVNQIVASSCQSVDVVAQDDFGGYSSVASSASFQLSIDGSVYPVFNSFETCSTVNAVSSITLAAGESRKQIWFMAPAVNAGSTVSLSLTFSANPDGLAGVPLSGVTVRSSGDHSFDIYAPEKILAGQCYAFSAEAKSMNNQNYYHYGASPVAVENGEIFSDSTCLTAATSMNFSSGKSTAPLYIKTSAATGSVVKVSISASGFITGEKNLSVGSGSLAIASLDVRHYNQTAVGDCVKTDVFFLNEQGAAINLTAALTVNLTGSGTVAKFTNDSSCMTSNSGVHSVGSGVSSTSFYFEPLGYGDKSVQLSVAGLSPYEMKYFAKYRYKLSAIPSATTANPGDCVQVSLYTQYQNGGAAYLGTATTINVVSSLGMYSDVQCQTSLGSTAAIASGQNMTTVYFLADNLNAVSTATGLQFQATDIEATSLTIAVSPRPALQAAWSLSSHKIASNYTLDLNLFTIPFTGKAPYGYTQTSGSGSLVSGIYSPVIGSASFLITDVSGSNLSVSTQAVSSVFSHNFIAATLPTGSSFSRSSAGKYFNATGDLVDGLTNAARFDRNPDPASGYASLGLLIEPASTNSVVYSSNLGNAAWVKSFATVVTSASVPDPAGVSYSDVLEWSSPTFTNMAYAASQTTVPTGGQTYSASVFVRKDTARFVGMKIHESGSSYGYSGVVIDLDTGSVVGMSDPWSGDYSLNYGVQKLKNNWYRIWTNYLAKGGSTIQMYLYPVYHGGTVLSPVRDNTISGRTYFWGAQMELGETVTSYIATTASAASRAADVFSVNTGSASSAYASAAETSLLFEYSLVEGNRQSSGTVFSVCGVNCSTEKVSGQMAYNNSMTFAMLSQSGADYRTQSSPALAVRKGVNKVAVSMATESTHGFNWSLNTASGSSATSYPSNHPNFVSGFFYLGNDSLGLNQTAMHLRYIELWTDKLSGPGLKAVTAP